MAVRLRSIHLFAVNSISSKCPAPRPARNFWRCQSSATDLSRTKVAVLYQALEPPIIKGVRKPMKPGGYRDSSADIAYVLQSNHVDVLTKKPSPDPHSEDDWCWPDTEDGIVSALEQGATHFWANTILFAGHPLQTSALLDKDAHRIKVIGQPPKLVDQLDDKEYVNSLLRQDGSFPMPRAWTVESPTDPVLQRLAYPVVGKPIRGRGSHGVKLCMNEGELRNHLTQLLAESPRVMVEEYLSGHEGTVTVLPPSADHPGYLSLPLVLRFNHIDGIAPYNGVVAVVNNSRVLSTEENDSNPIYRSICQHCERVAERLKTTAPIRIDVRQYGQDKARETFAIFDVNMKPNMTGPGRPGRENQASLTAMAATSIGWDYPTLLKRMLASACSLEQLRGLNL